ncbi:MAG: preprotein translocase subunit SecE [Candidatus Susulua stagnicola]|nr:preprotein translocase subunit SecE [Candidatus Susulua stagnicola]
MIKKIKGIPGFFKEVKEELKKVSWSSRHELMAAATIVVIITSLLTAYIAFVDLGLSRLVQILLR